VDAGSTGARCDAIACELGLSFGSGLIEAAVRVEELLAGFDVPSGIEDYSKGGELETIVDVREAARK